VAEQPRGTVTFLLSDIEGSTRLLGKLGMVRYAALLERHRGMLRSAFAAHAGYEVDCEGDGFVVAFGSPTAALAAAAEAQRALAAGGWRPGCEPRVRVGVHSGEVLAVPPKYVGLPVHVAARVMAAAHGGQVLTTRATTALAGALPPGLSLADLGEHRLRDVTAPERLFRLVVAGLEDDTRAPRGMGPASGALPAPAMPLIGRLRELDELFDLVVRRRARLVTLTGAGGVGKTRLALQLASGVAATFPDGVWLVDLAPVSAASLVAAATARALAVEVARGESPEEAVARFLAPRRALVVVDNVEHVIAAAPFIGALVAAATGLQVLATSRVPLRLEAERRFPVGCLEQPDAVALFAERARAVERRFTLDEPSLAAVREICRRVEGLPLAIELAASRSALLPPAALLARLDPGLSLLRRGASDAPARQRSVRATIEWSSSLLEPGPQRLFARLGVFAGAASLSAIEAMSPGGVDVLDDLGALVDASLVRRMGDGVELRYSLHAAVAEHARGLLAESEDEALVRRAHAVYFAELAERLQLEMDGTADVLPVLARFDLDRDNFLVALEWARGAQDALLELQLAAHLALYAGRRSLAAPGREWLEHALSRSPALPATRQRRWRARALERLGGMTYLAGDAARGGQLCRQALSEALACGDDALAADALSSGAWCAAELGQPARARNLADQGLAHARASGVATLVARLLNSGAEVARRRGDLVSARTLIDEAVELACARGLSSLGTYRGTSAEVALDEDDLEQARGDAVEAIRMTRALAWQTELAYALLIYAAVAARRGEHELAASLVGAAQQGRSSSPVVLVEGERGWRDDAVSRARRALGDEAFAACLEAGRERSLEEAADLVASSSALRAFG
jgi:predicted ATPase/class 3 adenylate cyclase